MSCGDVRARPDNHMHAKDQRTPDLQAAPLAMGVDETLIGRCLVPSGPRDGRTTHGPILRASKRSMNEQAPVSGID